MQFAGIVQIDSKWDSLNGPTAKIGNRKIKKSHRFPRFICYKATRSLFFVELNLRGDKPTTLSHPLDPIKSTAM